MGSGSGAVLVLVAACLAIALPCALASFDKFGLDIAQPKLLNSTNGSFTPSSHVDFDPSKSKRLSWHPKFVSSAHYDAHGKIRSSVVVNDGATNISQNNIDAGLIFHLADSKDIVVLKIEDRISLWSFTPKENGESMQILKYGANQSDPNKEETQSRSGANKLVTILIYLSDTKQGGETVFPRSKDTQAKEGTPSNCACWLRSETCQGKRDSAVQFKATRPDGIADKDSQYEACSVVEGAKWLAIKHMHASKIDKSKPSLASKDDGYTDEDGNCVSWAATGECDKNPVLMIGSPDYYGTCRKSCHAC